MSCRFTEDVVAHCHDGAAPDGRDAAALADHLRICDQCQRALARARRIDALTAAVSAVELDPLLAERMLGELPQPVRPRALPRLLLATTLVAVGFGLAWLWVGGHAATPQGQPQQPPLVQAGSPAPASEERDQHHLVLPDLPQRRRTQPPPRRDPFAPPQNDAEIGLLAGLVGAAHLETAMANQRIAVQAAAAPGGLWVPALPAHAWQAVADADAARLRRLATGALLAASSPEAHAALARAVDALGPGQAGASVLGELRGAAEFTGWLARELAATREPGQALRLAARLGGEPLDRSIRTWAGRDPLRLAQAADAVAQAGTHPDPVPLLLALWRIRDQSRDDGSDPFALAMRWFAPLDPSCAVRLVGIARSTPSAIERVRCLHALAALPGSESVSYLLELLEGPRRQDRLLACHALGRISAPAAAASARAGLRRQLPRSRVPELVLAALLALGDPQALAAVDRWGLPAASRQLLCSGQFTLEQLPSVLALLPDHRIENL